VWLRPNKKLNLGVRVAVRVDPGREGEWGSVGNSDASAGLSLISSPC